MSLDEFKQDNTPTSPNAFFTRAVANPGNWNNDIGFKIIPSLTPAGSFNWFTLKIYEKIKGKYIEVESYSECSSNPDDVDGYGNKAWV